MKRKFSKAEAERIFSQAAERQQARQKEDANQLTLEDLEEAGKAAGIDPAFIRAAASDLLRPSRTTEERKFFGFPVELRESHVLPLTFNEDNWQQAVDVFAATYKKPGRTQEVGTTRRWSSELNDNHLPTHIIAEKDQDGTRFTMEQKSWPVTLGYGIGASITLLMGILFFILWIMNPTEGDLMIPATIMTGIGSLLGLIGAFSINVLNKQEKQRFSEVFEHLHALSAEEDELEDSTATIEVVEEARISLDDVHDHSEEKAQMAQRAKSKG